MASQAGGLIQDQNSVIQYGASVGGKTNGFKALRKGGLGGRKPLGDLSNSVKPAPNQASKKLSSNIFSFTENNKSGVSKITNDASKKKSIGKTSEKAQIAGRKVLSDISNSGKSHLHEASNKNQKAKLGVVAEEPSHPGAIAEERFLHNHQECIKEQTQAIDMVQFLKTVGLDNDFSHRLASPWSPPLFGKMKPETPLKYLDLEEMAEQLPTDNPSRRKLALSPPCKTPKSPNHEITWKDHDYINFKLMETPSLPKG